MRGDEESEEKLVVLVDVPAEQPRQHDRVPEAGDRKGLSDPLREAEDDRLEVGDRMVHARESLRRAAAGSTHLPEIRVTIGYMKFDGRHVGRDSLILY